MSLFQKHGDEEHEVVEGVRIIEEFEGPDGDESEAAEPEGAPEADESSAADAELDSKDAEAETADTEAEDPEDVAEDEGEDDDAPAPLGRKVFVALIVVVVVISLVVGYVIGSGGIGAKGTGSATLTGRQLHLQRRDPYDNRPRGDRESVQPLRRPERGRHVRGALGRIRAQLRPHADHDRRRRVARHLRRR